MDDLLFGAENATAHLSNAAQALYLLTGGLDHVLREAEAGGAMVSPKWALQYCSCFFVLAREVERCNQDLGESVSRAYKKREGDICAANEARASALV